MKFKITTKMKQYLIMIMFVISFYMLMKEVALKIILFPLGIVAGYYTTMFGKLVPHVAPETMTAMTILTGIMFGSKYAFMYGLGVGLVVYSLLGLIKLTTLLNAVMFGVGGISAGFFMGLGFSVNNVFMLSLIVRTVVGILCFWNITSDKTEAIAHAVLDPLFNMALYMPFFLLIYNIIM